MWQSPRTQAINEITGRIEDNIFVHEIELIERRFKEQNDDKKRREAEQKAQENIIAGAHNGTNIADIATKAVTKVVEKALAKKSSARASSSPQSLLPSHDPFAHFGFPPIDPVTGKAYRFEFDPTVFQSPSLGQSSPGQPPGSSVSQDRATNSNRRQKKRTHTMNLGSAINIEISDNDSQDNTDIIDMTLSGNSSGGEPPNTQSTKKQKITPAPPLTQPLSQPSEDATRIATTDSQPPSTSSNTETQPMEQ